MTSPRVRFSAIAATALGQALGASPAIAADKDLVDTAVEAGQFETLAAALGAAGLLETLKGSGPFTVFAPTDAAFSQLPVGTVENLLLPENKEMLVDVLTYHVVSGSVSAAEVQEMDEAQAVNGDMISIDVTSDGVMVNDARVTATDIPASNGVIHVIDKVILPPEG